jgi:ribosome biogenesis protein Nip4
MPILIKIGILLKLDYFITNNDARNDIYIRAILRKYRLNIKDFNSRRVRYLRYIINLAAKAFLFGKNADVFKNNINSVCKNGHLEALRKK